MLRRSRATGPAAVLAALLGLLMVLGLSVPAQAAGLNDAADSLKKSQVYVDPAMTGRFSNDQAEALAKKLKKADKPIFVAVLPDSQAYAPKNLMSDLRTKVGIVGVYAVWRGNGFDAHADAKALSKDSATKLAGASFRSNNGDINATVNEFVDQAVKQTKGDGPQHSTSVAWIVVPVALLALAGGGVFLLFRRAKKRKQEKARAELAQLRTVVDEDITAFGEELDRLDFNPGAPGADDTQRADYTRALDSYDRAKRTMDEATEPDDVRPVTEALEDGRFALATLAARREGRPVPERRVPCFFDPRHGPSTTDVQWAPAGGAPRSVPACADDAARLAVGQDPYIRTVETEHGHQPYWNAGPAYSPWAGGYFGGGMLPGLLVGTMLGSMISSPGYAYAGGHGDYGQGGGADYTGGADAGEYSGAAFNSADFSGADFGGGDFGGGGGFGDFGGGDFGGGDFGD
ncbi:membrane protein [Kitasatospora griseola]|uniref:Membrane protein n=1 Tax=Kitasatospora griseola TaxID=2064 RepID=A0A0D0PYU5_KITGR|nr:membrane protein [Kitasatospora griseola]